MRFIRDIISEKRKIAEHSGDAEAANGSRNIFAKDFADDAGTPSTVHADMTQHPMSLEIEEQTRELDDAEGMTFGKDFASQNDTNDDYDDILAGLAELEMEEIGERVNECAVTGMHSPEPIIAEAAASSTEPTDPDAVETTQTPIEDHAVRADHLNVTDFELNETTSQLDLPRLNCASADSVARNDLNATISEESAQDEAQGASQTLNVPDLSNGRGTSRQGRAKTRLLGFNSPRDDDADPIGGNAIASAASYTKFPIGWLIVLDGPGRGAAFTLFNGVSMIGRGKDQTVRLDFGDNSISRENHAAIAFDTMLKRFFIGHGGKANLVRRNDRPVLSTEQLTAGDKITIGETILRFVPLCGEDFIWEDSYKGDWDHAARS